MVFSSIFQYRMERRAFTDVQSTVGSLAGQRSRELSNIRFPYADLETCVSLAKVLQDKFGYACDLDQLAAGAGHESKDSGTFRSRLAAAILLGILQSDKGQLSLTDIGAAILEASQEAQAKVTAFLSVPLYRKLFGSYKGKLLPQDTGLENHIKILGVSTKQADKARQVFRRSAEQAGLFGFGKDRLVLPAGTKEDATTASLLMPSLTTTPSLPQTPSYTVQPESNRHPAIEGMLEELPGRGEAWNAADLESWAATFTNVLRVVYKVGK